MGLHTSVYENKSDLIAVDEVPSLCRLAKDLEEAGEFNEASEVLSSYWQTVGQRPNVEGLTDEAQKAGQNYLSIQQDNLRNLRRALACR